MEALGSLLRGGQQRQEEKARLRDEDGARINAKVGKQWGVGW